MPYDNIEVAEFGYLLEESHVPGMKPVETSGDQDLFVAGVGIAAYGVGARDTLRAVDSGGGIFANGIE